MHDAEPGPVLWQLRHQEADVLTDAQLILGWVVEDMEPDFIADTAGAEEIIRSDLRQDLVQAPGQQIAHGPT